MAPQPSAHWAEPDEPVRAGSRPRSPLTRRDRVFAALVTLGPVLLAGLVLMPLAILGPYGAPDVVSAALVYGGLFGLGAGFVFVDRVHARHCPRCGSAEPRGATACSRCRYDLVQRPRYACEERHATYLDPGACACGQRLRRLPVARGVGRELVLSLKFGAGLLVVLLAVGLLLRYLEA